MVNTLITLNTTGGQSVKVEQVNTTTSVNCTFTLHVIIYKKWFVYNGHDHVGQLYVYVTYYYI